MSKLRADINYNRRIQQESNFATNYIELPQEEEKEKTNDHNENDENDENVIEIDDDQDDQDDENLEKNLTSQFNDHLDECLEEEENSNEEEIDVEDIEHPAQNADAKWKLEIMFKDNLHSPF